MKLQQVIDTIPVALQELHEAGHERVYLDQLGQQVTSHETDYLERRKKLRNLLSVIGIEMDEVPHGHRRPGAFKMYRALGILEIDGVIAGEFERQPDDSSRPRRRYYLANPTE